MPPLAGRATDRRRHEEMRLLLKTVVLTGAAGGFGCALARRCARQVSHETAPPSSTALNRDSRL